MGFERAGTFTAELALVNHGRYPLKVAGFPEKGAYYYGLESVEMASDAEGPRQPFRSFTLRRGASRLLVLHFRFADCDLQPGALGPAARTSLPIDYRVFGMHQRQAVPFPRFALSVPGGQLQPARPLGLELSSSTGTARSRACASPGRRRGLRAASSVM